MVTGCFLNVVEQGEFGGFADSDSIRSGGGGDSQLTYPFLVFEQVRRIAKAGSVEFRGGYNHLVASNPEVYAYVPATHETFSESVLTLANMLSGYFDDEMEKTYSDYKEKLSSIKQKIEEECKTSGKTFPTPVFNRIRATQSRLLFVALCSLLKRINFMQSSGVEEGLLDDR